MYEESNEAIWRQLSEYYQMPVPSSLSQALCQLIAEYATADADSQRMSKLVMQFLNHELKYYRQVQRLQNSEGLSAEDLRSLASKRSVALQDIIEQTKQATVEVGAAEVARQLLLAECYQQAQESDKVVAHLENAVADGADEPLVQFALGYTRFHLALESFGPRVELTDHSADDDLLTFQMACLESVSAFERALTGQASDSEVYEWIGWVLETAGFEEAAGQAFNKADDLAYSDSVDDEDVATYREPQDDLSSTGWDHKLKPITQEEIEEFGELLAGKNDVSKLMAQPEDDEEV